MLATLRTDLPPVSLQDPRWLAALAVVLVLAAVGVWSAVASTRRLQQFALDERLRTVLQENEELRLQVCHLLKLC